MKSQVLFLAILFCFTQAANRLMFTTGAVAAPTFGAGIGVPMAASIPVAASVPMTAGLGVASYGIGATPVLASPMVGGVGYGLGGVTYGVGGIGGLGYGLGGVPYGIGGIGGLGYGLGGVGGVVSTAPYDGITR
eukprot:TRINITY_DN3886_c0_g1_i4.p1 TRINITY_DN3886_c0_g1~~TRINITY_DN3886_c0_g1_i4.p1  ORF type:complete len:134 (-),score=18.07 TRINITY_DN3886_c0_g1_i4:226-627(-)